VFFVVLNVCLQKWEYELQGKHEHDKDSMEDYLTVRYAKGKSVDAHLLLDQKDEKKRHATFDLSYPSGEGYKGRDVKINADFIEKVCHYWSFVLGFF
jgi:hypothetical protein